MLMFETTHKLEMKVQEMRYQMLSESHQRQGMTIQELLEDKEDSKAAAKMMAVAIKEQQETIKLLTQDLVILKGAGRIEDKVTVEANIPDNTEAEQRKAIEDARDQLNTMISTVETRNIPPELVEAATPKTQEDWQEEHKS